MHLKTLLLTTLTVLTHALPLTRGTAQVQNNCPSPVYIWSTDTTTTTAYKLSPSTTWTEPLHQNPTTGIAIKIGTTDTAIWTAAPLLHFGYALNDREGAIYYSVSSAYGIDPLFQGKKVLLTGSEGKNVPSIEWWGGESGTKAYVGDTDLYLTLCAS